MIRYVWLEVIPQQDEWRCAITMYGAQCVMIIGMLMMLEWPADNLDCRPQVSRRATYTCILASIYVHAILQRYIHIMQLEQA